MKKYIKILLRALLLCGIIITFSIRHNESRAITIGENAYLQRGDKGLYTVQKWIGDQWYYIIYSVTNYVDENGISRVAYCIDPDKNGIGYIDGEYEGYDVDVKELISDERLWRVYTNGYPYKTPEQMGVEDEQDAYLATKQAAYCIIRGYSLEEVINLYRAGQDYVEGQNLEDIQRKGQKVVDAIYRLVDIGYNGSDTIKNSILLEIVQDGNLFKCNNCQDYYLQKFIVKSDIECATYTVKELTNFPEGTQITNENGEPKNEFQFGESFYLMIPKDKLTQNISGTINITGICKNYPIFYSECAIGDYQNYILCCDEYSNCANGSIEAKIDVGNCKLKIKKVDKDSKMPIKNVKFSFKYENGEIIGTYNTDEKGEIKLANLKPGTVIAKEESCDNNYVLDNTEHKIKVVFDKETVVEIENELKEDETTMPTIENKIKKSNEILPRTGGVDTGEFLLKTGMFASIASSIAIRKRNKM